MIAAVKENNTEKVKIIINCFNFENYFYESKKPTKIAIESGNFLLAQELLNAGFKISQSLIINSIKSKNSQIVENFIKYKFYESKNTELMFWYLLKQNMVNSAEELYSSEDCLRDLCSYDTFNSVSSIQNVVNSEDLLIKVLDQALDIPSDHIACIVLKIRPDLITSSRIFKAFEGSCINFLKIL